MSALDAKLLRDLWRMKAQILAIALVIAAAIATLVLSLGVHRSLSATRDAYYARYHFADVFGQMTRAPRQIVARVGEIPGVARAEGGIIDYAVIDLPGRSEPIRAVVNALGRDGRTDLNQLVLRAGRLPRDGHATEVVIDEPFAAANALAPGDTLDALIHGNRQRLVVVGLGLAPNYIWAIAPGELMPDERRFGIIWMGREPLEAATDRVEAINSVALTLAAGAREGEVIRRLDALLAPYGGTGAYGRIDHPSHAFLDNELMQLDAMTRVIPPVFLLVATFLVAVVLGRMVRTEREQIGLLKAFGYGDRAVAWHYLKFALAIALIGAALGIAAGVALGRQVTELYAAYYRFPFLSYRAFPDVFGWAALLALLSAALGALGGVRAAVRLTPAVAMAPPPPPAYRAGMVERLGRLAGFTTTGHMIVRHIARWPARSAVTVLGVALALGLLFSTMQFLDSATAMLDNFFFRAQRQDVTVSFIEPRQPAILHDLARLPGVLQVEATRAMPVRLSHGNLSERTAIEAVAPGSRLSARVDNRGQEVPVPPNGLLLSRSLADQLDLAVGDAVTVELLNGRRTVTRLRLAATIEELVGTRAYASEATLLRLTRDAAPVGMALLRVDPLQRDALLAALREMPVVLGVSERDASLVKFRQMIDDNMLTMIGIFILFASAIAVGVVYNSARILFSERAQELATLRVLGYHRSEVAVVLLGELALLLVLAVPVGCGLGYWMAQLMTLMFSSDLFRLPFAPDRSSYGWASLVIMAAGALTAVAVARRVMHLDMVRVLKARD